jgi:hypothetical protein
MDVIVFLVVVAVGGYLAYKKVPAFKARVDKVFKSGE